MKSRLCNFQQNSREQAHFIIESLSTNVFILNVQRRSSLSIRHSLRHQNVLPNQFSLFPRDFRHFRIELSNCHLFPKVYIYSFYTVKRQPREKKKKKKKTSSLVSTCNRNQVCGRKLTTRAKVESQSSL